MVWLGINTALVTAIVLGAVSADTQEPSLAMPTPYTPRCELQDRADHSLNTRRGGAAFHASSSLNSFRRCGQRTGKSPYVSRKNFWKSAAACATRIIWDTGSLMLRPPGQARARRVRPHQHQEDHRLPDRRTMPPRYLRSLGLNAKGTLSLHVFPGRLYRRWPRFR